MGSLKYGSGDGHYLQKLQVNKEKTTLILDENYMMGMFDTLGDNIPEHKKRQGVSIPNKKIIFFRKSSRIKICFLQTGKGRSIQSQQCRQPKHNTTHGKI